MGTRLGGREGWRAAWMMAGWPAGQLARMGVKLKAQGLAAPGSPPAWAHSVEALSPNYWCGAGMDFDLALRMFMDSFRPPGEGQKIDRIMQVGGVRSS